jgi:hypothetical protein
MPRPNPCKFFASCYDNISEWTHIGLPVAECLNHELQAWFFVF